MRAGEVTSFIAAPKKLLGTPRWSPGSRPNQFRLLWPIGWKQDYGCLPIGFVTEGKADEKQRWIAASGIETRPAPPKYNGPQLTVAGVKPS